MVLCFTDIHISLGNTQLIVTLPQIITDCKIVGINFIHFPFLRRFVYILYSIIYFWTNGFVVKTTKSLVFQIFSNNLICVVWNNALLLIFCELFTRIYAVEAVYQCIICLPKLRNLNIVNQHCFRAILILSCDCKYVIFITSQTQNKENYQINVCCATIIIPLCAFVRQTPLVKMRSLLLHTFVHVLLEKYLTICFKFEIIRPTKSYYKNVRFNSGKCS